MYTQFFRLSQPPFSIAPDPRYLFMSERHREALAHLLYGVGSGGGFVLLTGEIGAGKTTICRCFLEQIPAGCNVAYIFNPKLTVPELLQSICDEFRIGAHLGPHIDAAAATAKDHVDALNRYLLASHAEGRSNVLVIDEAQNLTADVLEQLRLLTNLETNERKLLQIILIGQPELRAMLAKPELEQLAQRVIARYHLASLSQQETAHYVLHRLAIAGSGPAAPFSPALMRRIHQIARGVPRRINLLCDRALLGAYAEGKPDVTLGILRKAAREVFGGVPRTPNRTNWRDAAAGLMLGAAIAATAVWTAGAGFAAKTIAAARSEAPAATQAGSTIVNLQGATASDKMAGPLRIAATLGAARPAIRSDLAGVEKKNAREETPLYRDLAQLWGVDLPEGGACTAARNNGLHCYSGVLGLPELRQLDRPAILTLQDENGKPYYALLTGLTGAGASLRIGGAFYNIGVDLLERHFSGDFTTLWRAPQNFHDSVGTGDRGADVDWLATQLAKVNGVKQPPTNQPFDIAMTRQVREFQRTQGLLPDGLVGPRTFMHLNNIAGAGEPRLKSGMAIASATPGK
jgi:general secretion pathway protein A